MNTIQNYISNIKMAGMSEHTIRSYEKDINKLSSFFGGISEASDFEKLTSSDFQKFYSSLNLKPTSINGAVRNIDAFYAWMINSEKITTNNHKNFKFGSRHLMKEPVVKREILTDNEAYSLIQAGKDFQERFMLALMLYTAIRRSEVADIKLSDINGCKILIHGKGNKERTIFLNETLCTMLSLFMSERKNESEYLFYGTSGDVFVGEGESKVRKGLSPEAIYYRVKAALKRAGINEKIDTITPHRLRGTSITRIIEQFGIHAAMGHAGHAVIATTMRYDSTGENSIRDTMMNQFTFKKG